MVIAEISKFKGSTMCVLFEDEQRLYIHSSIVSMYNLREGIDIPEEAVQEIAEANEYRKAKERAMYLLDCRDYSAKEMYEKLRANYSKEISAQVCGYLEELRLIDDRRYAGLRARELFEIKKVGMFKAKMELRRRGISNDIIEEVVEPYSDKDEAFERLEQLVERKYERYLTDEKGVRKVKSALQRQGYSFDEINAVLDLYDLEFEEE